MFAGNQNQQTHEKIHSSDVNPVHGSIDNIGAIHPRQSHKFSNSANCRRQGWDWDSGSGRQTNYRQPGGRVPSWFEGLFKSV